MNLINQILYPLIILVILLSILGYGYIFIAGMFNDAVIGFPIGISSLTYLVICGFAAYLKNITS